MVLTSKDGTAAGTFHPAFRQLVEGELAKEILEEKLINFLAENQGKPASVQFFARKESYSNLVGNNKINKKYFAESYPCVKIEYIVDHSLELNEYILKEEKR